MERDILLIGIGGLIGALSSLATLFVVYILEGMRLRRQWAHEDQVRMRQKREELQALMFSAEKGATASEGSTDD